MYTCIDSSLLEKPVTAFHVISIAISVDFYITFNVVSETLNTSPGVVKSDNRQ